MHPTFLIIGPPKCASTSLHFYLGQHPEIFVSKVKEPHFFSDNYDKGIAFYENYFKDAGNAKCIGEATPAYSFLPFAMEHIQNHYPEIKLIICFRNPMERAFSHWLMLWTSGIEKASFTDAININLKQLSYVNFEGSNGEKIWKDKPNNIDIGEKWVRTYIQPGMYASILKDLQKRFRPAQIKYIFLDDLKADFDLTMQALFTFIEVDPYFDIPIKEEQNFHYDRFVFRLLSKITGIKTARKITKIAPKNIKDIFKQKKVNVKEIPRMHKKDYQSLQEIFRQDIEELEKMTNRNLSHWMRE